MAGVEAPGCRSSGKGCDRCGRSRQHENIWRSSIYDGDCLPFEAGTNICVPCFNYCKTYELDLYWLGVKSWKDEYDAGLA